MSRAAGVVAGVLGLALVGVAGVSVAVTQHWGPWARDTTVAEEMLAAPAGAPGLPLTVEPGPCPAYTVDVAGLAEASTRPPGPDGSRSFLFPDGSFVLLTCLGTTAEVGSPLELATDKVDHPDGSWARQTRPVLVHAPFGEAVRWSGVLAGSDQQVTDFSPTLTDWYTERDGAVVAIGYLRKPGTPDRMALVTQVVAGLGWA